MHEKTLNRHVPIEGGLSSNEVDENELTAVFHAGIATVKDQVAVAVDV